MHAYQLQQQFMVGMDEQDPTENFTGCWNSQLTVHINALDLAGKFHNEEDYLIRVMGMIFGQTPTNIN